MRRSAISLLAMLFVALFTKEALTQEIGTIKSLKGNVMIVRSDTRVDVSIGDPLFLNDRVLTEAQSSFGATLDDGTTLAIGEKADVGVESFVFEPGAGLFDLIVRVFAGQLIYGSGRIGAARPDRVKVETPQLSVGTRGTRFAVIVPSVSP
ncbi:MAG: FecR domain-containing protein [Pseudomonadota bacterium]